MSAGNRIDRRDYDLAASQAAQRTFAAVAARLEALIDERDREVHAAMSDYLADGVSADYAAVEVRWNRAAGEVRTVIQTLRGALERNDATARDTLRRARAAVDAIG